MVGLNNSVSLIRSLSEAEPICSRLLDEPVIGLDVETTMYQKPAEICLVQISTRDTNYIFDICEIGNVDFLKRLMLSRSVIKVIHNASFETRMFGYSDIEIINVFDTLKYSRRLRGSKMPGGHGLKVVTARELGVEMDKSEQCSDWTLRPLSNRQIFYAALDSEVLLDLYDIFSDELSEIKF